MDFNPFAQKITDLNSHKVEKGCLLIAEPFMQDPYFKRSVVLICDHSPEGTLGFILNHPLQLEINQILSDFPKFPNSAFLGGPVKPENLFFLHRHEGLPGRIKIIEGLYWGGDFDLLKKLIERKEILSKDIRFFLGYSGWDHDQIQTEVKSQSWIIHHLEGDTLLSTPSENLWKSALKSMGKKQTSLFAEFPEDPSLN